MSALTRPTSQPGSRHTAKKDLTGDYPLRIITIMKGEELRKIRKQMGLTQAEFADLVGVHWNSIARQERNEIGIRESQAKLIRLIEKQHTKKRGR